ncbi:hypothetical protein E2C01_051611 [Portunus trituberculatus]|uniref:Uncharacterized protein n=1 Tax=Portunus trituberculatus TaxID=210409 RepID=A0A5B7GJ75_PORTR|nr:hypothetical protein [Portunus trituberculatus]
MFDFTLNTVRTVLRTPSVVPDDRVTVISIPGRSYITHQSPDPTMWSRRKHSSIVEEFGDLFLDGEYYRFCLIKIADPSFISSVEFLRAFVGKSSVWS